MTASSSGVYLPTRPVSPTRNILQAFVDLPIVKVSGRHESRASRRVNEPVKAECSRNTTLRFPVNTDGSLIIEIDTEDFCPLMDTNAAFSGMLEQDVVELGSYLHALSKRYSEEWI